MLACWLHAGGKLRIEFPAHFIGKVPALHSSSRQCGMPKPSRRVPLRRCILCDRESLSAAAIQGGCRHLPFVRGSKGGRPPAAAGSGCRARGSVRSIGAQTQ
jgi:hypothetical protein